MGARDTECQKNGNHRDTENESRSTFTRHHSLPWVYSLVLHIFHQPLGPDLRPIDIALGICGDALRGAGAGRVLDGIRNKRRDCPVLRAADANAAFPAIVVLRYRLGFGIGDIDDITFVDVDSARAAELCPLIKEFSVLVENLDAVVLAVPDEQPPSRIHRDRMRNVELPWSRALLAPSPDELALLRELHYAGVGISAVAVSNEDMSVGSDVNCRWRVELVEAAAWLAGLAERQQHFSIRTELEDLVTLAVLAEAVGHPNVSLAIDMETVRKNEHSPAKGLHELSR